MATWYIKRHDGHGVTDLGPTPGRMGRKQIRQHLQRIAVRAGFDKVAAVAIDPETRDALLARSDGASVIAHAADGLVLLAERDIAHRTKGDKRPA